MIVSSFFLILLLIEQATTGFIPPRSGGLLSAFGDFNSDGSVDLVVVNDDTRSLSIYYYQAIDALTESTVKKHSKTLVVSTLTNHEYIASVIPGDFNGDSTLDIMVLLGNEENDVLKIGLFRHEKQGRQAFKEILMLSDLPGLVGQPLVCDVDGNQLTDLVGKFKIGSSTKMQVLKFASTGNFTLTDLPLMVGEDVTAELDNNFAHVFAHVSGDSKPDLLFGLADSTYQILTSTSNGFKASDPLSYPPNAKHVGSATVVDVDLDGFQDMVLPVCEDDNCLRSVLYYRSFKLFNSGWNVLHSFVDDSDKNFHFLRELHYPGLSGMMLRSADVNLDGYPDFVALMSLSQGGPAEALLLINKECSTALSCVPGKRGVSVENLNIPKVEVATFYDSDANGRSNLLYSTYENKRYILHSKNLEEGIDGGFSKVSVIGGLCRHDNCNYGDSQNLGANLPGPTISYTTIGNGGDRAYRRSIANALSQSTHFALQNPYIIFGLGSSPNFIQSMSFTLGSGNITEPLKTNTKNVIPNSHVILIPHPWDKPNKWSFQLLINPSDVLWRFAVALAVLISLLSTIALLLQYREKRQDDRLKRMEAHKFHFDAM